MNPNPSENNPVIPVKTQCFTLWDRQRRMLEYYNLPGTMYIALGKQTPWKDATNPNISDTYPPNPKETMSQVQELIGMQRINWKKFAKPYLNPTTEQKDDKDTVNYKGLYYQTTDDVDYALANEFTTLLVMMSADRDQYFPVSVQFRQVCLLGKVDSTNIYLSADDYNNLSPDKQGNIITIENFMPLSRQDSQNEKFFIAIDC